MNGFKINQTVFFIDYIYKSYRCPHCGNEYYEQKTNGISKGYIAKITTIETQDGIDKKYTIYYGNKPMVFTDRRECDMFLTQEEAETALERVLAEED